MTREELLEDRPEEGPISRKTFAALLAKIAKASEAKETKKRNSLRLKRSTPCPRP